MLANYNTSHIHDLDDLCVSTAATNECLVVECHGDVGRKPFDVLLCGFSTGCEEASVSQAGATLPNALCNAWIIAEPSIRLHAAQLMSQLQQSTTTVSFLEENVYLSSF